MSPDALTLNGALPDVINEVAPAKNLVSPVDDNPVYVNYLRNEGVLVFQPIMSDAYIDEFSKKDKYFTCHFQRNQFKNIPIE